MYPGLGYTRGSILLEPFEMYFKCILDWGSWGSILLEPFEMYLKCTLNWGILGVAYFWNHLKLHQMNPELGYTRGSILFQPFDETMLKYSTT